MKSLFKTFVLAIVAVCVGSALSSCSSTFRPFYHYNVDYKVHYPDTTVRRHAEIFADTEMKCYVKDGANYIVFPATNYTEHSSTAPYEIVTLDCRPHMYVKVKRAGMTYRFSVVRIEPELVEHYFKQYKELVGFTVDNKPHLYDKSDYKKYKDKVVEWFIPLRTTGLETNPNY